MIRNSRAMLCAAALLASCAGLPPGPPPDAAASSRPDTPASLTAADPPGVRAVRVLASRRELRVVFPRDTARAWGWSALQDRGYRPAYAWSVYLEGMDGPRSLSLIVQRGRGEGARRFGSLEELVAAAARPAALCAPGMIEDCSRANVAASVEDGAVVLTLRDSAAVARLVGLRPEWVTVSHARPEDPPSFGTDTVRVEYVHPQLPLPDSALRAEAVASRRRYEARVKTISRYLSVSGSMGGEAWLVVGDSVRIAVQEIHCHFDYCGGMDPPRVTGGWRVGDSTVVRLRTGPDTGSVRLQYPSGAVLVARRTGRTSVRVTGLTGPSDTLPSSQPVAHALEVAVVVAPPVGRVELSPRVRTGHVGQPVQFQARAFDARGAVIAGAPVQLRVEGGAHPYVTHGPDLFPVHFSSPGRYTVTASFGGRSDTLQVDVAPARDAPASP